jgi:hypothetical protein
MVTLSGGRMSGIAYRQDAQRDLIHVLDLLYTYIYGGRSAVDASQLDYLARMTQKVALMRKNFWPNKKPN